jgi:hypothetical protein
MGATGAVAAPWVARPAMGAPGAGRWGGVHAPSGRWVAFGSEARCRAVAAQLRQVDASLRRPGAPETGADRGRGPSG